MPSSFAFQITSIDPAFGSASFSISTRLALRSTISSFIPVTSRPGRARLAINRIATASPDAGAITIGIVWVACLAANAAAPLRDDNVDLDSHELSREARQLIDLALREACFVRDVT